MMRQRYLQGFTLIELLIVIAIIGILAAVLIPNLLAARKRANDTTTQAYLREVMRQQEIYYLDKDIYAVTVADLTGTPRYLKPSPSGVEIFLAAGTTGDDQSYMMCGKHKNGKTTFMAEHDGQIRSVEQYEDQGGTLTCGALAVVL